MAKPLTTTELTDTIDEWTPSRVRPAQGLHCPAQVTLSKATTDRIFEQAADGRWRLTWVSSYGNLDGITGGPFSRERHPDVDASGQKITDPEVIQHLDALVADAPAVAR